MDVLGGGGGTLEYHRVLLDSSTGTWSNTTVCLNITVLSRDNCECFIWGQLLVLLAELCISFGVIMALGYVLDILLMNFV